jgi:hypothetical protein
LRLRHERCSVSFDQVPIFAYDIKGKVATLDFSSRKKKLFFIRIGRSMTFMTKSPRVVRVVALQNTSQCDLQLVDKVNGFLSLHNKDYQRRIKFPES